MTLYCIIHSIIDYTELQPPIVVLLHHFMCNLLIESLVSLYFVQDYCDKINMVSELTVGQIYFPQKHGF